MRRLLALFRTRRLDAELDDELLHHLEALEKEHRGRGLSIEEARLAALRDMGGIVRTRESYREQRGIPLLETMWRDIRLAMRSLRRTPGVTAAVIATMAIGIGANTAIFSVVNGVLLKPLPYPDPSRLVSLDHLGGANADDELPSAPYLYFTYRDDNRTLAGVGLWRTATSNVTGIDRPEQVHTLLVTSDILPILGVPALLGREFSAADDAPGGAPTVILTYGYWQRRFGGDPSVLGRRLVVGGQASEVVGIMPAAFRFLDAPVDIIAPFQLDRTQVTLGRYVFSSVARLKPDVSLAAASADLARLVRVAIERFPPPAGYTRERFLARPIVPRLRPLKQQVVGDSNTVLWILMGALALVLLIACANVANLLLVRASGRQQELAIRTALGATRGRIASELLTESLALSLLGGALGLVVAYEGLRTLLAIGPTNLPRIEDISIDRVVLLFTLAISLFAGLLFGLLPVMKYATPALSGVLASGGRAMSHSRERNRARGTLVVVQVAIALVLLICSGLMIRTFQALGHVRPGFSHPEAVQMTHVSISFASVPNPEHVARMQNDIVNRIVAIPGAVSAAFVDIPPLAGGNTNDTVLMSESTTYAEGQPRPLRRFEFISPGLFQTLGMPVVAGRDFTWEDLYGKRPVAVVAANLARSEWGSPAAALGKRVRAAPADPWREIVGIVGDLHDDGMSRPPPPIVYFPALMDHFWGAPTIAFGSATFVVRTDRAGTDGFIREMEKAVWDVNPDLPIADVRTLADVYQRSLARTSFALVLLSMSAAMGLLLGFIGVYGVISYVVSQRAQEIGIRMALGAPASALKRMFVAKGVAMAGVGIVAGLAAAAALTQVMSSLLFGVSPLDPATYAAVVAMVVAAAIVAAYLPARRATRGNLLRALR
jgi:putative ABC transport system permease protein